MSIETSVLQPIDSNPARVERVANALRTAILAGTLSPGERLSVPEVARRLNVSRTPAREALLILEQEGLVLNRPQLGAEVVRVDDSDLTEMLDLREALEGMAARLAAENMSPADKRALSTLLEEHEAALDDADAERHVEIDLAFHRLLGAGARNARLAKALLDLERQSQLLLNVTSRVPGFAGRAVMKDHHAIVSAVFAGDGDRAEAAARAHVQRIKVFCASIAASEAGATRIVELTQGSFASRLKSTTRSAASVPPAKSNSRRKQ